MLNKRTHLAVERLDVELPQPDSFCNIDVALSVEIGLVETENRRRSVGDRGVGSGGPACSITTPSTTHIKASVNILGTVTLPNEDAQHGLKDDL